MAQTTLSQGAAATFRSAANNNFTELYQLFTGKAGGNTFYGGTLTTQSLTLRPNAADSTTGQIIIGSTLTSSSKTTGSLKVLGGMGVAGPSFLAALTCDSLTVGTTAGILGGSTGVVGAATLAQLGTLVQSGSIDLTIASATPGNVKNLYMRTLTNATMSSGTLSAVRGELNVPNSAAVSGTAYLFGVQGKLVCGTTTTLAVGSGHACGLYGQIDISGASTLTGHVAAIIASVQDTTSTARTALNGIYVELPAYGSGAKANSVLQGYGGVVSGLDLTGNHMDYFVDLPDSAAGAKVDADIAYAHYRKMPVRINGVDGWVLIGLNV